MASVIEEIVTAAAPAAVWDAVRDVGALHTRLVPGFVVDTVLEPGARIVTFANGMVIREPLVTIDEARRRLVWGAEGGRTTHFNASVAVEAAAGGGSRVVWTADFLPHEAEPAIAAMMRAGAVAMAAALERLQPAVSP